MPSSSSKKIPIAVLISGTGRSLKNLIDRIEKGQLDCEIKLVIASTATARGVQYAEFAGIPIEIIERSHYESKEGFSETVFSSCTSYGVELVVMAGYLKLLHIPDSYHNRVVNIHPSLLPAFGGKGCFGNHVHEKAIERGVRLSGCTVHFVDNQYDDGPIILQKIVPVYSNDTAQTLNDRVFYDAECDAYPEALQLIARERITIRGRKVIVRPEKGNDPSAGFFAGISDSGESSQE